MKHPQHGYILEADSSRESITIDWAAELCVSSPSADFTQAYCLLPLGCVVSQQAPSFLSSPSHGGGPLGILQSQSGFSAGSLPINVEGMMEEKT